MADARGYLSRALRLVVSLGTSPARLRPRSLAGWLLLAGAIAVSAHGATAPTPAAVRFTVFSAQPVKGLTFVPRPNAAPQELVFQPTARSARHEYRGPMPLRIIESGTGTLVAEATIPAGIRDALLLFLPIADGKGGGALRYQVAVLDDGAGRHGPGGLAILNLSGLALSGTVGAEKVTLKAGLNPTLPLGRTTTVSFSTAFKGRTYRSYVGTVALGRNERALLILFPPFYAGGLEVQSRLLLDQPPGTTGRGGKG
jgi:hypothetical protein